MKRYYLCPIRTVDYGGGPEFEPDIPAGVNYSAVMPPDPAAAGAWALVLVATPDHRALLREAKLDALPEFPMDAKLNAMQGAARVALEAALTRRAGVTVNGADGYRDLIRQVGRKLDPNFHENAFDVSE
jgi:hypothetical protein